MTLFCQVGKHSSWHLSKIPMDQSDFSAGFKPRCHSDLKPNCCPTAKPKLA